ncbi:MAG: hypothetical protein IPK03_12375 [Bacteroidetes bacterium]|nr:hypothetical protein [Bacteroidota bacterium]
MDHFQFVFEKRFFFDFEEAYNWYENKEFGRGERLRLDVLNTLEEIHTFPKFEIRYNEIRCKSLGKFPFMIHFHIDRESNIVFILALISTHKDPNASWLK